MFLFVSIMRVPDEGYSRNASCALSLIYSFYYMHVLHTVRFQHRIVFLAWKLMMTYEWNQNNHTSRMTSIFQLWISFSHVVTSHQLQHITAATILQSMHFLSRFSIYNVEGYCFLTRYSNRDIRKYLHGVYHEEADQYGKSISQMTRRSISLVIELF
jgi:hypothetical protein